MQSSELKNHLKETYGIPAEAFDRLMEEFLFYFGSTLEEFVRERHLQLQKMGKKNPEIYRQIAAEARNLRFAADDLSERRVRRIIYG